MILPEFRRILYATDLGHEAHTVMGYALTLAKRYGASINILYALEPMGLAAKHVTSLYTGGAYNEELEHDRLAALKTELLRRLDEVCSSPVCTDINGRKMVESVEVIYGKPGSVILDYATSIGADLIVLGSHGHSTMGEVMLGSTAHRVAQKSCVPVLLIPSVDRETGDSL